MRFGILHAEVIKAAMKSRGPLTYDEMAQVAKVSKPAVQRWVKTLREGGPDSPAYVRVAGWKKDATGRPFVPRWLFGPGADLPRPGQRRTDAERMQALRLERRGMFDQLIRESSK